MYGVSINRPWVVGELRWIRNGPLFRVHRTAQKDLFAFLDRFSYRRVHLDGSLMTSEMGVHAELARGFQFESYYGMNWDAFNE